MEELDNLEVEEAKEKEGQTEEINIVRDLNHRPPLFKAIQVDFIE
jgi:hypothetical protein